jgi:hypothetical protein
MIDEDNLAVGWGEDFELVGHGYLRLVLSLVCGVIACVLPCDLVEPKLAGSIIDNNCHNNCYYIAV